MKILPLITTKLCSSVKVRKIYEKLRYATSSDTVEISKYEVRPFKQLNLKTFKKLYETKYNPEKLPGYYSTFVIDEFTGEPVTVFIDSAFKFRNIEKYEFYIKNKQTGQLENIGYRSFSFDKNLIAPGFMVSYQDKRYLGLGIREQQIAIERMHQLGLSNVAINPLPSVVGFHEGCGFENTNCLRATLSKEALKEWDKFIDSGQKILL